MTGARVFELPPYPYDRVQELRELSDGLSGGTVDCSVGTPCDAPPAEVVRALAASGTERGYPASAGGPGFRRAAADWLQRRFEVSIDPSSVTACVGTKEFVASVAHHLRLRRPERDTVLYPAISYPTYAMGATLAGCRAVPVSDLDAIDPTDAERALLLWVNSPANPTGSLSDLSVAAAWGRAHGVPVFSDECYAEFTWDGPPRTILQSGLEGAVAVHSLSKRSNLAGIRAGFIAGDPELVEFLRAVRQHAGLMMPGPVQAAAAVALADDLHVLAQRERYHERLTFLADHLTAMGCPTHLPQGGFYLWVPVPRPWSDGWEMARDLAAAGGILVSPGELYGSQGAGHVRIAAVQPMVRLRLVTERLAAAGWGETAASEK